MENTLGARKIFIITEITVLNLGDSLKMECNTNFEPALFFVVI